jgi:hypothetical protein
MVDAQAPQSSYLRQDSVQAVAFLDSLLQAKYLFAQVQRVETYPKFSCIYYQKGQQYKRFRISLPDSLAQQCRLPKDFETPKLDSIKNILHQHYYQKAYLFNRVKTKLLQLADPVHVALDVELNQRRYINGFVLNEKIKMPKAFLNNIQKEFKNQWYSERNLKQIQQIFEQNEFLRNQQTPKVLLRKDSTIIYLYLQKKSANFVDGILGFGSTEDRKFKLNGSFNAQFSNIFNAFEKINIFWQKTPSQASSSDLGIELPYLLNTNLGLQFKLNTYAEEKKFGNFYASPGLFYHFTRNQKIGLKYQVEFSTLTDKTLSNHNEYSKSGFGLMYEYQKFSPIDIFQKEMAIQANASYFTTDYQKLPDKIKQYKFELAAHKLFHITGQHYLLAKTELAKIQYQEFLGLNEMFRLGGWNSLRGTNERSLVADAYWLNTAEYRYLINDQAFFDAFVQQALVQNTKNQYRQNILAYGLGFNFYMPVGLMSFQLSKAEMGNGNFSINDLKIQWGLLAKF